MDIDRSRPFLILMADDDADDRMITEEALQEAYKSGTIRFVHDGVELLEYLRRTGGYEEPCRAPRPDILLLDLNMPRKGGIEALQEIKSDPRLRWLPVVILSTSSNQNDVVRTYDLGANSYIVKSASFEKLVEAMRSLTAFWADTVRLVGPGSE